MNPFRQVRHACSRLKQTILRLQVTVGFRYLALVSIVYGVEEGIARKWITLATDYVLSDSKPSGFGLNNDGIQRVYVVSDIPWQLKSIYGIASDLYPILGYRRTSYLVISSAIGVICWMYMYITFSSLTNSLALFSLLLLIGNYGIAAPDVMIDADIAEKSRLFPDVLVDLQTLCWVAFGFGSIFSDLSGGYILSSWSSSALYGLTAVTALSVLVPSLLGYLNEKRVTERQMDGCSYNRILLHRNSDEEDDSFNSTESSRSFTNNSARELLLKLTICQTIISLVLGACSVLVDNNKSMLLIAFGIFVASIIVVVRYLGALDPTLAKASLYIFISRSIQPDHAFVFLWQKRSADNCCWNGKNDYSAFAETELDWGSALRSSNTSCDQNETPNRPCFSPEFISTVRMIGSIAFIIGTVLYNRYLSNWSYRRIWIYSQALLAFFGLLDVVWILRWNQFLGVPDWAFALGDKVIVKLLDRLSRMPMYVLAASLCPPGLEASVFAVAMSLSNLGWDMAAFSGILLQEMFGGIRAPMYKNLEYFLLVSSMCRLLPVSNHRRFSIVCSDAPSGCFHSLVGT